MSQFLVKWFLIGETLLYVSMSLISAGFEVEISKCKLIDALLKNEST